MKPGTPLKPAGEVYWQKIAVEQTDESEYTGRMTINWTQLRKKRQEVHKREHFKTKQEVVKDFTY